MSLVTTGYAASWVALGLLPVQETCSTLRKAFTKSWRSMWGWRDFSEKRCSDSRMFTSPHYSLLNTPAWNASLSCRSNCSVEPRDGQRLAELFLLPSGFQRLCSDFISLLLCRSLCYPEHLTCGSTSTARVSPYCWGQLNTAGVGHWADPFLVWRLGAGTFALS